MAVGQTGLTPQILRPRAAPTDSFVRSGEGQQLAQLAAGLAQFAPALMRFGGELQDRQNQRDKIAGENRAREIAASGKTYRQAIEQGLIKPEQSPWFRVGAYETFGRTGAYKYDADLKVALAESPVAESTKPDDFDAFEGEFRTKWMKEHLGETPDAYLLNAFGAQADTLVNGLRVNFAEQAGGRLVKQTGEAFHAEVFSILKDGHEKELTVAQMAAGVQQAIARQVAVGMNKSIANQLVASAVASAAKATNDASFLRPVLGLIKIGTGSLEGTSYGAKLAEEAENEIAAVNQSRQTAEYMQRERMEKLAVEGITSKLVEALNGAANPALVDLKPFIAQVSKIDPSKAETYLGMRDAFANRLYQDDPEVKTTLFLGVHTSAPGTYGYTTQARLDRALAAKSITPATYAQLSADVKQRDTDGGTSKLFNDDGLKDLQRRVRAAFVAEFGGSTTNQRLRAESAVAEATDKYLRWRQGPGAAEGPIAVNQWINDEVGRQFQTKGDQLDVQMNTDVPAANFGGPKRPKVEKVVAADPTSLYQLRSEFDSLSKGQRKGLSTSSVALLRSLGIPADPAAIKQFLDAQAKLLGATQ
jgi:hypothetical protein